MLHYKKQPIARHRIIDKLFFIVCLSAMIIPMLLLIILLGDVFMTGIERLNLNFLTSFPSRKPQNAGILPAILGSSYLVLLTGIIALPLGISAAIYMEEYSKKNRLYYIIEITIANLASVPSIIYGMLGLTIFVRALGLERSILAGALTMSLLILPIIIITSREALHAVPRTIRDGCYALGATRWQMIWQIVLPTAFPNILTGAILAIARAIGETAPLIIVGAVSYITFLPISPFSEFTALPIQILNWISRPQPEFAVNASAAIIVLLTTMLLLNAISIFIRYRVNKQRNNW